jgi:MarR family 2-MHQ and catechol resistance regulon transcriptional repressor
MTETTASSSGVHVWLVLMKAHRSLQRYAVRSIEAFGLGLSDFAILELLLHKGPQNVNEIGRRVDLTSGSITSAIDRLATRGLVERCAHPSDRRICVVRLTALGTQEISKVFAVHAKNLHEATRDLSKAERTTLIALLKKLGTSADARRTMFNEETAATPVVRRDPR